VSVLKQPPSRAGIGGSACRSAVLTDTVELTHEVSIKAHVAINRHLINDRVKVANDRFILLTLLLMPSLDFVLMLDGVL
jgi:hypothetical protein